MKALVELQAVPFFLSDFIAVYFHSFQSLMKIESE